jgi:hypothetical protein
MSHLEDIRLPAYDIDSEIANLVRALIYLNIGTEGCCQGHLDSNRHSHPWVSFELAEQENIAVLTYLVGQYNQKSKIQWQVSQPPPERGLSDYLTRIYAQIGYGMLHPSTWSDHFRCCLGEDCGKPVPKHIKNITPVQLKTLQMSSKQLANYIFQNRVNQPNKLR